MPLTIANNNQEHHHQLPRPAALELLQRAALEAMSCGDHMEQLTYLMFLKMAGERFEVVLANPPFGKKSSTVIAGETLTTQPNGHRRPCGLDLMPNSAVLKRQWMSIQNVMAVKLPHTSHRTDITMSFGRRSLLIC